MIPVKVTKKQDKGANMMPGVSGLRDSRRLARSIALIAIGLLVLAPRTASAQSYPRRPIHLLHGFAAGGAADTLARIVSEGLSKRLGQPVVVEAKTGAGGNIAATAVANAAPDGYTLGLVTGAHAISGALYKSLPYNPTDSFEMV